MKILLDDFLFSAHFITFSFSFFHEPEPVKRILYFAVTLIRNVKTLRSSFCPFRMIRCSTSVIKVLLRLNERVWIPAGTLDLRSVLVYDFNFVIFYDHIHTALSYCSFCVCVSHGPAGREGDRVVCGCAGNRPSCCSGVCFIPPQRALGVQAGIIRQLMSSVSKPGRGAEIKGTVIIHSASTCSVCDSGSCAANL